MAAVSVQIVDRPEQAAVILDPIRLQLLSELAEPYSASGLARRLGLTRQRINYHLKELEKASLIELVAERRKGNCTELFFQATARSYQLDPSILGPLCPNRGHAVILDTQIRIALASDRHPLAQDLAHGLEAIVREYDDQLATDAHVVRVSIRLC